MRGVGVLLETLQKSPVWSEALSAFSPRKLAGSPALASIMCSGRCTKVPHFFFFQE